MLFLTIRQHVHMADNLEENARTRSVYSAIGFVRVELPASAVIDVRASNGVGRSATLVLDPARGIDRRSLEQRWTSGGAAANTNVG